MSLNECEHSNLFCVQSKLATCNHVYEDLCQTKWQFLDFVVTQRSKLRPVYDPRYDV